MSHCNDFRITLSFLFRYVWYLLLPLLILLGLSISTGFLAVNVLLNESADEEYMGLVNGIGMTVSSAAR